MNKEIFDRINEDTWIISDTHLGHRNILEFEPCRLTQMRIDGYEADEHDKWIIETWNSKVNPDDTVLHLGDFAFKNVAENIEKLNGNIILILGNHDGKGGEQKYKGLDAIKGFYYLDSENLINKIYNPIPNDRMLSGIIKEINGEKMLFCHYALFDNDEWDRKNKRIAPRIDVLEKIYRMHECDKNIHGHIHSNNSAFDKSVNASFEHIGFSPIKIKDLLNK
jgi:calcineurin-like phosphoesterase family protein